MSLDMFGRILEGSQEVVSGPPGVGFNLTLDGDFDLQNKKLTNVAHPTDPNDATTLETLQKTVSKESSNVDRKIDKIKDGIETLHKNINANLQNQKSQINNLYTNLFEQKNQIDNLNKNLFDQKNQFNLQNTNILNQKSLIDNLDTNLLKQKSEIDNLNTNLLIQKNEIDDQIDDLKTFILFQKTEIDTLRKFQSDQRKQIDPILTEQARSKIILLELEEFVENELKKIKIDKAFEKYASDSAEKIAKEILKKEKNQQKIDIKFWEFASNSEKKN